MLHKIFALAVSGVFIGFTGAAVAHDMAERGAEMGAEMGAAMAMPAPTLAEAGPAQIAATDANAVTIDNFAFGPAAITVAAGTKVTWTNRDDEPHTVASADDPKVFKSGPLDTGDSFSFTFDRPGTYRYFCSIHPHMTGTVVVK
jgi:plastocyanin